MIGGGDGVPLALRVRLDVPKTDGVEEPEAVAETVPRALALPLWLRVPALLGLRVRLSEAIAVNDCVSVPLELAESLRVTLGVLVGDDDPVLDHVALPLRVTLFVTLDDCVVEALPVVEAVNDGERGWLAEIEPERV